MELHLYPTVYSKTQSIEKAIKNLKAYPEQGVNCVKALKYSIEFVMKPGAGTVGTLSEYKDAADVFILHFSDGDVEVKKQDDSFITDDTINYQHTTSLIQSSYVSTLNSLLHIPKTHGNFNMAPSFATILFSALKEANVSFTVKKNGKFNDDLIVILPNGKEKTIKITGETSVIRIMKQLK